MKTIILNNIKYQYLDKTTCFDNPKLEELVTDYFVEFDYIVGDYAYSKIRLKGFCDKKNKNYKKINDINNLDKYLKDNCAYGCKFFILKKVVQ